MSQAATPIRDLSRPTPGLVTPASRALSPEQQLEALRRVQAQADQRVKLGLQLFKAAEAHTSAHRQLLEEVKAEQSKFRTELQDDVSRSMESYDLAMEKLEDDLTGKLRALEDKIAQLQDDWKNAQSKIEGMLARSVSMLDQGRSLNDGKQTSRGSTVATAQSEGAAQITLPAHSEEPLAEINLQSTSLPIYTRVISKLREREDMPPAA